MPKEKHLLYPPLWHIALPAVDSYILSSILLFSEFPNFISKRTDTKCNIVIKEMDWRQGMSVTALVWLRKPQRQHPPSHSSWNHNTVLSQKLFGMTTLTLTEQGIIFRHLGHFLTNIISVSVKPRLMADILWFSVPSQNGKLGEL